MSEFVAVVVDERPLDATRSEASAVAIDALFECDVDQGLEEQSGSVVWQLRHSERKLPSRVAARLDEDTLTAVAFTLDEPPLGASPPIAPVAPVAPARKPLAGIDWAGLTAEARGEVALVDVEAGEGQLQEWGQRGK